MRSKHFTTPYMQSPPPAVFHDNYQWEIWKNTAGKSANFPLALFSELWVSQAWFCCSSCSIPSLVIWYIFVFYHWIHTAKYTFTVWESNVAIWRQKRCFYSISCECCHLSSQLAGFIETKKSDREHLLWWLKVHVFIHKMRKNYYKVFIEHHSIHIYLRKKWCHSVTCSAIIGTEESNSFWSIVLSYSCFPYLPKEKLCLSVSCTTEAQSEVQWPKIRRGGSFCAGNYYIGWVARIMGWSDK